MIKYRITYSTITPESAEIGDHAEHGFFEEGGWRYPMDSQGNCDGGEYVEAETLRDLLDTMRTHGIYTCEGARWFYSDYEVEDYSTGEVVQYSLHLAPESERHFERIAKFI